MTEEKKKTSMSLLNTCYSLSLEYDKSLLITVKKYK